MKYLVPHVLLALALPLQAGKNRDPEQAPSTLRTAAAPDAPEAERAARSGPYVPSSRVTVQFRPPALDELPAEAVPVQAPAEVEEKAPAQVAAPPVVEEKAPAEPAAESKDEAPAPQEGPLTAWPTLASVAAPEEAAPPLLEEEQTETSEGRTLRVHGPKASVAVLHGADGSPVHARLRVRLGNSWFTLTDQVHRVMSQVGTGEAVLFGRSFGDYAAGDIAKLFLGYLSMESGDWGEALEEGARAARLASERLVQDGNPSDRQARWFQAAEEELACLMDGLRAERAIRRAIELQDQAQGPAPDPGVFTGEGSVRSIFARPGIYAQAEEKKAE